MNTLKKIVDFVGIPSGSLDVAGYGGPPIRGLSTVSLLVTGRRKPTSMRAIIRMLQNLTPITLEAEIVGNRSGEEPFEPIIRLNASGGIIWRTVIVYHLNGNAVSSSDNLNSAGGDFTPTQLGPGRWQFVAKRSGISNTGFVSLSKPLDTITVSARHQQTPAPPPPVVHPPTISAVNEGAGAATILIVTGSGFLPNKTVTVRVVDDVFHERNFQQSSTAAGELKMRISLPCNSGLPLHVSATDSRSGPGILGVVFSNNVTLPCP